MKKSSLFVLKSFFGPFTLTFFIAVFVLMMQFVWKYIEDLVGKGLEFTVIAELLFYTSASMVPLALPLAVLLSSLMTFGNLGENYELVAFKSAGISLQKVMRPLAFLILILSMVAFMFSNYVLPVANLKMRSLLYDIMQQKPAVNILPGIFYNEIEGFTIKVHEKKTIDDVDHLSEVMIYDHSEKKGNRKVIIAKSGKMENVQDNRFLEITLYDGYGYDDQVDKKKSGNLYRHTKNKFKEKVIRIDMSQFQLNRTDEDLFKSHYEMLNLRQLVEAVDTLESLNEIRLDFYKKGIRNSFEVTRDDDAEEIRRKKKSLNANVKPKAIKTPEQREKEVENKKKKMKVEIPEDYDPYALLASLTRQQRMSIFNHAINSSRGMKTRSNAAVLEKEERDIMIVKHVVQWHKKLTLSYACIVLFLIGAPLGSIIRKGGLGMPVVVSIIFFIIFHILNITGEKLSKEMVVDPAFGMWIASMVLTPVGLFITYKATTDSTLLDLSAYAGFFKKFMPKKDNKK